MRQPYPSPRTHIIVALNYLFLHHLTVNASYHQHECSASVACVARLLRWCDLELGKFKIIAPNKHASRASGLYDVKDNHRRTLSWFPSCGHAHVTLTNASLNPIVSTCIMPPTADFPSLLNLFLARPLRGFGVKPLGNLRGKCFPHSRGSG